MGRSSTGATLEAVLFMTKAKLEYERTGEGLNCYIVGDETSWVANSDK